MDLRRLHIDFTCIILHVLFQRPHARTKNALPLEFLLG